MTASPITSRPHRWMGWAAAWLLAACAVPDAPQAKPAATDTATLHAQIRDEIGDAACSASEQCHTLAVGHKACGGPETYVVWSSAASDGQRLKALAEAYTQASRVEAQQSGRVSNCMMVTDPGARCDAGRCVPAGRSPALMQ